LEKYFRKLIPKLALYNYPILIKSYEKYASIRYRRKFDQILEFRNSSFVIGKDITLFPSVFLGVYEEKELDVLLGLEFPEEMIFWDVGANVGIYSVLFGKKFPAGKVIAFEPNFSLHVLLTQNLDLNGVNNVRVENFALSNAKGVGQIEISKGRAGAGKIKSTLAEDYEDKSFPIITGDMYVKDFPEAIPSLIKIDVEGHEPEVIEGLSHVLRQYKPVLMIEVFGNLWDLNREEIWDQMLNDLFNMYGHGVLVSDGEILKISEWNRRFLTGAMQTLILGSYVSKP
jgi:FkbM family methyltransferase